MSVILHLPLTHSLSTAPPNTLSSSRGLIASVQGQAQVGGVVVLLVSYKLIVVIWHLSTSRFCMYVANLHSAHSHAHTHIHSRTHPFAQTHTHAQLHLRLQGMVLMNIVVAVLLDEFLTSVRQERDEAKSAQAAKVSA